MTEHGTTKPSDGLRKAAMRRPHLRNHLKEFKQITGEFPLFIEEPKDEYESARPNVLYPVGGPIYCHVYGDLGQETKYYAIEPEMSGPQATVLERVKNKLLAASGGHTAPDSEPEYDACRRRAKAVPSDAMADFFDRLGYTLGAGQPLEEFLISEQDVMLAQYETVYESSLSNLEVMKDLYMSMILSMTFALVFAIVRPILTGNDPTATVAAVIVLFVFVQLGFYAMIRATSPSDPIWYHPEERSPGDLRLWASLVVGGGLSFLLIAITTGGMFGYGPGLPGLLWFLDDVRLPLYVAVPVTPLLLTGIVLRSTERSITARDAEFPSFVRALGATESAKQSTTSDVLETLRDKDFGALSPSITRLYRRLNVRISTEGAWAAFSRDTRSYLIQKFSEMYLVGRRMGGDPKQLGELISQNMNAVNQLREQRRQAAVTFIGLLYGITAAATFAFFIGLEIVAILAELTADFGLQQMDIGQIVYPGAYDIPLIEYLLLAVVTFNAALSSQMIRTIDGGNPANGYVHFVLLTWLGAATAIATRELVGAILSI